MIQGENSLTKTNLTTDTIGADGCLLSDFIQQQGDNPPLKKINLRNLYFCNWGELFRFTSTCKYLTDLKSVDMQSG